MVRGVKRQPGESQTTDTKIKTFLSTNAVSLNTSALMMTLTKEVLNVSLLSCPTLRYLYASEAKTFTSKYLSPICRIPSTNLNTGCLGEGGTVMLKVHHRQSHIYFVYK